MLLAQAIPTKEMADSIAAMFNGLPDSPEAKVLGPRKELPPGSPFIDWNATYPPGFYVIGKPYAKPSFI